jgi:hypothetical protein
MRHEGTILEAHPKGPNSQCSDTLTLILWDDGQEGKEVMTDDGDSSAGHICKISMIVGGPLPPLSFHYYPWFHMIV